MKITIVRTAICLAAGFMCLNVTADEDELMRSYLKIACIQPCRRIDGKAVDLSPKFMHAKSILLNVDDGNFGLLWEWKLVIGRVFQVADNGLLIKKYSTLDLVMQGDYELVFVRNERHQQTAADDDPISAIPVLIAADCAAKSAARSSASAARFLIAPSSKLWLGCARCRSRYAFYLEPDGMVVLGSERVIPQEPDDPGAMFPARFMFALLPPCQGAVIQAR